MASENLFLPAPRRTDAKNVALGHIRFLTPNVRVEAGPAARRQARATENVHGYLWPGPGGLPLGLASNEVLGIAVQGGRRRWPAQPCHSSWRASEASRSALQAVACHEIFKPPQQGDAGRSKAEWRPDELAKNLGCRAEDDGSATAVPGNF